MGLNYVRWGIMPILKKYDYTLLSEATIPWLNFGDKVMTNGFDNEQDVNVNAQQDTPAVPSVPDAVNTTGMFSQGAYTNTGLYGQGFFGGTVTNAAIDGAVKTVQEIIKGRALENVFVIPLTASGLRLSGYAVAMNYASVTKGLQYTLLAYVMFEDTMHQRTRIETQTIDGKQTRKLTTPDDLMTGAFLTKLDALVRNSGKVPAASTFSKVGYFIVPTALSQPGPDGTYTNGNKWHINAFGAIGEMFAQTVQYVFGELIRDPLTIKNIYGNRRLSMDLDTSGTPMFDLNGLPVRNDFSMVVNARDVDADGKSDESSIVPLTRSTGYIETIYTPLSDTDRINNAVPGGDPRTQTRRWTPVIVLTDIASQRGVVDIDSFVNGVLSQAALAEKDEWRALFLRRFSNSTGARLRDVGTLPLELGSAVFDTKATTYTDTTHFQFLDRLFMRDHLGNSKIQFALDVPNHAWLGAFGLIIRQVADNDPVARTAFLRALNQYTGTFPLDYGKQIFVMADRPVVYGTYTASVIGGSQKADVRDWMDYLTMLTQIGATDIERVKKFDATLNATGNREERTVELLQFIESVAGGIDISGKGNRYYINPAFINDLQAACLAAKLNISHRSINSMGGVTDTRGGINNLFGDVNYNSTNMFGKTTISDDSNNGTTANAFSFGV